MIAPGNLECARGYGTSSGSASLMSECQRQGDFKSKIVASLEDYNQAEHTQSHSLDG